MSLICKMGRPVDLKSIEALHESKQNEAELAELLIPLQSSVDHDS